MKKLIFLTLQILILIIIVLWVISSNQKVDFFWKGIIFTSNASFFISILIFLVVVALIIQRIYLYFRQTPKRIKDNLKINKYPPSKKNALFRAYYMPPSITKEIKDRL